MASGYTANYGLCQWEPEDQFLREEFNEDYAKLDAALKAVEDKAVAEAQSAQQTADRALDGLETANYNLYGLMLQNDYDSKSNGWKKALLFDGFWDSRGISQKSDTLVLGDGCIGMNGVGSNDVDLGYGEKLDFSLSSKPTTMTENGSVTGFQYKVYCYMYVDTTVSVNFALTVNGTVKASGTADPIRLPAQGSKEFTQTLPEAVPVAAGDVVVLRVSYQEDEADIHADSSGSYLGGKIFIRTQTELTGHIITIRQALPAQWSTALGWVRHKGGQVSLSLDNGSGGLYPFTTVGDRDTQTITGIACTERSFRLDQGLGPGSWAVRLDAALNGSPEMAIYDYGIALL